MKTTLHRAESRGHADHGWLISRHTFSFASYYDPERIRFGLLRVLNDDIVKPGAGFGEHPHDNMEIVSIPISGALEHKDSEGNRHVIRKNEIQAMSAGTGIVHSEYNHSIEEDVNFLQIWVFPKEKNIKPRYEQRYFEPKDFSNRLRPVVSPEPNGDALWINQDAHFFLGKLDTGHSETHKIYKKGNGIYIFVIDGKIEAAGLNLGKRDGAGIEGAESIEITAAEESEVLLIEVPMN